MSLAVEWNGIEEFQEWLQKLPVDAAREANNIVEEEANYAAFQIRGLYAAHVYTGTLQRGVKVAKTVTREGVVSYTVKSTSPLAFIFEFGTKARHYVTVHGVTKLLGAMPPAHIFITVIIGRRRLMYLRLKDMLVRFGFLKVFGDA